MGRVTYEETKAMIFGRRKMEIERRRGSWVWMEIMANAPRGQYVVGVRTA